jgi:hypothetical protein
LIFGGVSKGKAVATYANEIGVAISRGLDARKQLMGEMGIWHHIFGLVLLFARI